MSRQTTLDHFGFKKVFPTKYAYIANSVFLYLFLLALPFGIRVQLRYM